MANEYVINATDAIGVADVIREEAGITDKLNWPEGWKTAIRGIKGGVELNFEVVGGTTQPSNPKENTIWVNTDQEITGWGFGAKAERPNSPDDGMVWFSTTEKSTIKFNALKEDSIVLTPENAYQYISGAWEAIAEVRIYQSGNWVLWWDGTLYSAGDEYVTRTGGWTHTGYYSSTYPNIAIVSGTKNATNLYMQGADAKFPTFGTQNKIDLTGKKSITFKGNCAGVFDNTLSMYFCVSATKDFDQCAAKAEWKTLGDFEVTIPFNDEIYGEYYISVHVGATGACKGSVTEVYLK